MEINLKETNWQYYQFFDNGYGISVTNIASKIRGDNLELAVLKTTDFLDWEVCYDTPITRDVKKYLTEKELIKTINKVKALPNHLLEEKEK